MDEDTQLEISERVAFWEIQFEREFNLLRAAGHSKSTARSRAAERADLAADQRFPVGYK